MNDFFVEVFEVESKLKKFCNCPLKNEICNALSFIIVKADGCSKSRISFVNIEKGSSALRFIFGDENRSFTNNVPKITVNIKSTQLKTSIYCKKRKRIY